MGRCGADNFESFDNDEAINLMYSYYRSFLQKNNIININHTINNPVINNPVINFKITEEPAPQADREENVSHYDEYIQRSHMSIIQKYILYIFVLLILILILVLIPLLYNYNIYISSQTIDNIFNTTVYYISYIFDNIAISKNYCIHTCLNMIDYIKNISKDFLLSIMMKSDYHLMKMINYLNDTNSSDIIMIKI